MKNNTVVQYDFQIEKYLAQQTQTINDYLDRFLPPADFYPEVIHEAMRYSVLGGGKRIRPILALATGEALEGDFRKMIYLACALEMIHNYSLVHDDLPVMDDDDYRRGQFTTHKKFGEGITILAGDALLSLAFQLLSEISTDSRWAETSLAVIHRICRAIGTSGGMIAGQAVDLTTQGKPFSGKELEYIHSSKTGALIQASVFGAALLSEASAEACQRINTFGSNVGLAFQIVDDILDVEGSREELGKISGKDYLKRKATYPALYGVETSRKMVMKLVEEAVQELAFLGPRGEVLKALALFVSFRRF